MLFRSVSDAALYLPLAVVPPAIPLLVILIVILAGLSEYAGVLGVVIGASRRYDGPMGKSDRAFCFGAIYLALGLGLGSDWVNWLLAGVLFLLVITVFNRCRRALGECAGGKKSP